MNSKTEQQADKLWEIFVSTRTSENQELFWAKYDSLLEQNRKSAVLQKASVDTQPSPATKTQVVKLEATYKPPYWVYQGVGLGIFIGLIPMIGTIQINIEASFIWLALFGVIYFQFARGINTIEVYTTHLRIHRKMIASQIIIPWDRLDSMSLKERNNQFYKSYELSIKTTLKEHEFHLLLSERDMDDLTEKLGQKGFGL